ncbi:MAG: SufD family Fe-S cluster assembly protein [Pseudomonadota bacterium]
MTPAPGDLIKDPNAAELDLVAAYDAFEDDPRRERAFTAFAANGLPHRRMEAFKWTDFKARLKTLNGGAGARPDPFSEIEGHSIVFRNGRADGLEDLPEGLRALAKTDGQSFAAAEDVPLGAMTAALTPETIMVEVTEQVRSPLKLIYVNSGDAGFARIVFLVRKGASVDIVESQLGGAGLNASLSSFSVQSGGRVTRTMIQPSGAPGEAMAITADIHLSAEAEYVQTVLAFGGQVARIETRLVHEEDAARATLNAAYLAGQDAHIDFTSHVRHGARACVTEQRTKGAVMNGGEGVFQGKFHVPRNVGQQTDADMQHNALLLEDGAVVNAKPELEIYADDVACAHGNTCGALDDEALFYMRQRGIPELAAKALLTEAFIAEALETAYGPALEIMTDTARSWLQAAATETLQAG